MRKLFLVLPFFFLSSSLMTAATYYVATTGDDGRSCATAQTITTPKRTVASGVGCLNPGDTLYIRGGTYSEGQNAVNAPSGNASNRITILAYPSEVVTLTPNMIQFTAAAYVTYGATARNGMIFDGAGIWIGNGSNHIILQNIEIKNTGSHGLQNDTPGSGFNQYLNLTIHDAGGDSYSNAIYTNDSDAIFDGIEIYHSCGAMQIYHSGGANVDNVIVRNTYIHDTSGKWQNDNRPACMSPFVSGDTGKGQGLLIRGNNNLIYNTVVANIDSSLVPCNQCGSGISLYGGGTGNRVFNNTVSNMKDSPNYMLTGSGVAFRNNLSANWSNPSGQVSGAIQDYSSGATKSNNLCDVSGSNCTSVGAPAFVNSTSNFRLTAGSAAIGAGINLNSIYGIPSTDADGTARSVPWDVGAFEFASGGTPSITVLTPNGGNSWTIGSTQTITWSSVSAGANVEITLDRGNDGNFEQTISASTTNDGSFDWVVDGAANANCKIKIKDTGAATNDVSDAVFAIAASGGGGLTKIISNNTVGSYIGDVTGVQDTYLWSLGPTLNQSADTTLYVVKPSASDYNHGLIYFPISQIPTGATVTSVTFRVYLEDAAGAGNETINIRRVLRNVNQSQATWNEYSTGNAWATAGGTGTGDRNSTVSAALTNVAATPGWYSVTSTGGGQLLADIQDDVTNGTSHWYHLEDATEGDVPTRGFTSSDGVNGQRPALSITYTTTTSSITLSEPKSGDIFLSGQTGPARWTSSGVSGNVRIDLSRDNGTTWETLVASTAFNSADTTLTYLAPTSSNCKVRVVSLNDTNIVGTSSAFRIGGTRAGFLLNP